MTEDSSYERADQSSPPMRTRPSSPVTSSVTMADRPTSADVPVLSSGGCRTWRMASGRTMPRPAPAVTTNAMSWKGRARPTPPTTAAAPAATASRPKESVVVMISATPSTAARISQTIHNSMVTPGAGARAAHPPVRGRAALPRPSTDSNPPAPRPTPLLTARGRHPFTHRHPRGPPRVPGPFRARYSQLAACGAPWCHMPDGPHQTRPAGQARGGCHDRRHRAVLQPRRVRGAAAGRDDRRQPAPDRRHVPGPGGAGDVPTGRRWTYAGLDLDTDGLAQELIAAGIEAGDRVGIWAPNCAEWVLLQYATAKAGIVLVNINPAYRTSELGYALRQSGVRVLVSAESFKTSDYRAMVDEVRSGPDGPEQLERVIYLGAPEWEALLAGGTGIPGDLGPLAGREASLSFDDPINIQYTSGTTGFPKGATLSHHNILNNGFFIGEGCRYTEQDRVCIPVPFYHCFGMVLGNLACTTHGACIVIPAPGFEPAATLAAVQAERCTSLYGVPTMFIAELALPDFATYDLSTLRTGIMAGSPCPVEVMKRVVSEMHMTEVTICYGMTETSPVSTQTRADDDMERRVSTVGRVHPHVEVKVIDPGTGLVVPRGTAGELCTRGYSVMLGYWDDEAQTDSVIDAARWMHTGDLAVMDAGGYLNIAGRIKDMVIRGGENVYPREVEEFLYTHPAIEDVQVIGVPDAKYGEELCAWVKLRPGAELSLDELREFCTGQIAHFKVPRYLRITEGFPMTVTGKVQKFVMREVSVSELDLEDADRTPTA